MSGVEFWLPKVPSGTIWAKVGLEKAIALLVPKANAMTNSDNRLGVFLVGGEVFLTIAQIDSVVAATPAA